MPAVPFPDAHGKSVQIFVELVEEGDGLDDHVVGTAWVELDLCFCF
jgi:hypothetical protein